MPNKQTTSLEERFNKKFAYIANAEYQEGEKLIGNFNSSEYFDLQDVLGFLHQELQAERQEIKRMIEEAKAGRPKNWHHNEGLDNAIALIEGREGDGV